MKNLHHYLSYAGTLPFIACTLLLIFDCTNVPILGPTLNILSTYTLLIASFMAGAHWGQHLHMKSPYAICLAFVSNMMILLIGFSHLLLATKTMMILFSAVFLTLLFIDKHLLAQQIITSNYFRTRGFVTLIVIICLLTSGAYL